MRYLLLATLLFSVGCKNSCAHDEELPPGSVTPPGSPGYLEPSVPQTPDRDLSGEAVPMPVAK